VEEFVMLRYYVVGLAFVGLCGQARAQSITISTVTPNKDQIEVSGIYMLNGKAYVGGALAA
jgi:hypothetical protein